MKEPMRKLRRHSQTPFILESQRLYLILTPQI